MIKRGGAPLWTPANVKAAVYGALNIISASGIVFANKAVFQHYDFHFTYALTWIHTVFTLVGMRVFASAGMFQVKPIQQALLVKLSLSYVAYIVLCNLSLKVSAACMHYRTHARMRLAPHDGCATSPARMHASRPPWRSQDESQEGAFRGCSMPRLPFGTHTHTRTAWCRPAPRRRSTPLASTRS